METPITLTVGAHTRKFFRRNFVLILLVVLAALLVGGGYAYGRYSVYKMYPQISGIEKSAALLQKVGKLIQLPADETPTMATVTDAASAKKLQSFLSSAEKGDVLIVYPITKVAILYRPTTNKLIAVGPVNSAGTPQAAPAVPVVDKTVAPTHATTSPASPK